MRNVWSSLVALAAAGSLAGCGGGGGSGGAGGAVNRSGLITSAERTGPANFTAEQTRNYALAQVGALGGNVAGNTGAGITVGIIDTGIDLQHQDFTGAIDPDSIDIVSGVKANVDDQGGHGTAVAGVIGARADGYDARGIAPESTLLAVRAESSCSPSCTFYHSDLARATGYAVANGAKVLNFSLGGSTLDPTFQTALANALNPANGEHVIVAAAGNIAGNDPINPATFLAGGGAQGRGIAVGAVDAANQLASFSNKAGTAKDFFLVAPGVGVVSSANGGGSKAYSGTSFAAPQVSGAAAVVWGASPYLTGAEVVDILLLSATDLGTAGVDEIYGHGLLNLDRAMDPLGPASIPTGATVSGGGAPLASTSVSLGSAFGDALSHSTALSQGIFLDSYGRPFQADLSGTIQTRAQNDPLGAWLDPDRAIVSTTIMGQGTALTLAAKDPERLNPIHDQPGGGTEQPRFALSTQVDGTRLGVARGMGLNQMTGLAAAAPELAGSGMGGNALASPYLGLSGDGTALSAGRNLGDGLSLTLGMSEDSKTDRTPAELDSRRQAALAEITKRFADGSMLGGQAGTLSESAGPLGSSSDGAFAFGDGAETRFLGLFGTTPLSHRTTLFARAGLGRTDGDSLNSGLLRDATGVTSQTFAVGTMVRDVGMDGDRVSLTAAKPLRASSGSATLTVPVGRTMDGTILTREERVRLSPSGSETDFELSWSLPLGGSQHLVLGGMMALEPDHDAGAAPAFATGAKYRLVW